MLSFALVVSSAAAQPATWTIDSTPLLRLGAEQADSAQTFAVVVGATRLPDGRVLVGDRADFSLLEFSSAGKLLRSFGRRGAGPGEFQRLYGLLRCGDSVVTRDQSGNRESIFSLDGRYVRSFRFGSPQPGRSASRTACNLEGMFAHVGLEHPTPESHRPSVPFWISGPDSVVRTVLGRLPGIEYFLQIMDGRVGGASALPLGKDTHIAMAGDRLYVGTADRFEVAVFDFTGKQIATIAKPVATIRTTDADIEFAKEREIDQRGRQMRGWVERNYATIRFPEALPAYGRLLLDADGNLWVQDYPRPRSSSLRWSVFSPEGRELATVALPSFLEVYEIGRDYVLGRFLDPGESIPEVRLYRLRRR